MAFTLTVLGSGSVVPAATRTAPAYWVEAGGVRLLLDCGAGAVHRAAAFGVPWHAATHVALTHFHVDHWGELGHYLFALRWGIEPARAAPLTLLGPRGLRERLTALSGALGDWVLAPGFPLEVVEVDRHLGGARPLGPAVGGAATAQPPSRPTAPDVTLEWHATPHTEESVAYAVRHSGARLVYTGDTGPSADLARWAAGCDLLLAECSLPDERAIDIHLTPTRAAALARDAGAKSLVLTHFYPPVDVADAVRRAAETFAGPIAAVRDGDRFVIGA
jgi:ribonuclease BN (tRNA processing enzyme)